LNTARALGWQHKHKRVQDFCRTPGNAVRN
jgi:hypothetical protein